MTTITKTEGFCNATFKFENCTVKVCGSITNPYFSSKYIAAILDFADRSQIVKTQVSSENKMIFNDLRNDTVVKFYARIPIGTSLRSTWISPTGIYELINISTIPQARIFKQWIFKIILPAIRANQGYSGCNTNIRAIKRENRRIKQNNANYDNDNSKILKYNRNDLKPDGFICIITSRSAEKNNQFKVIAIKDYVEITTFKFGKDDYCINMFPAESVAAAAEKLYELLAEFKSSTLNNMYTINYIALAQVIKLKCYTLTEYIQLLILKIKKDNKNDKYGRLDLTISIPNNKYVIVPKCLEWFYKTYEYDENLNDFIYVDYLIQEFMKSNEYISLSLDEKKLVTPTLIIEQLLQDSTIYTNYETQYRIVNNFKKL